MQKMRLIAAIACAAMVSACGGSGATKQAASNLEAAAQDVSTNLEGIAANTPDSTEANSLIDQSVNLTNAEQAAARVTAKKK